MWRPTRPVVDTGMLVEAWSKACAVAFKKDKTALSAANIEPEVNRYIADPVQPFAYKLGELKIRDLRTCAERALGWRFDLRRFHDAVLGQGAVLLHVFDDEIVVWIMNEQHK